MISDFQAETLSLFSLMRLARETPACAYFSEAFHLTRAQLERSSNAVIRKRAASLPIAYKETQPWAG